MPRLELITCKVTTPSTTFVTEASRCTWWQEVENDMSSSNHTVQFKCGNQPQTSVAIYRKAEYELAEAGQLNHSGIILQARRLLSACIIGDDDQKCQRIVTHLVGV